MFRPERNFLYTVRHVSITLQRRQRRDDHLRNLRLTELKGVCLITNANTEFDSVLRFPRNWGVDKEKPLKRFSIRNRRSLNQQCINYSQCQLFLGVDSYHACDSLSLCFLLGTQSCGSIV